MSQRGAVVAEALVVGVLGACHANHDRASRDTMLLNVEQGRYGRGGAVAAPTDPASSHPVTTLPTSTNS